MIYSEDLFQDGSFKLQKNEGSKSGQIMSFI